MKLNHIKAIGVELEGGWEPDNPVWGDKRMHGDGSVDTCLKNGEFKSEPLPTIVDVVKFMDKCYPEDVNDTCGLHVHFSMNHNDKYTFLANMDFFNYYMDRIKKFTDETEKRALKLLDGDKAIEFKENMLTLRERISGANSYCKNNVASDFAIQIAPMHNKAENRYKQLNFCYNYHNTFEIRTLNPFTDKSISILMVIELAKIIEDYISDNLKSGKLKIGGTVGIELILEPVATREVIICV